MEKKYYLYVGISLNDIAEFMKLLVMNCISFDYTYIEGSITVYGDNDETVNNIIEENGFNIHDTPEEV